MVLSWEMDGISRCIPATHKTTKKPTKSHIFPCMGTGAFSLCQGPSIVHETSPRALQE